MLAVAKLGYENKDVVKALTEEKYAALAADFPEFKFPEYEKRDTWYPYQETIVDVEELEKLTRHGLSVTLSKVRGMSYPPGQPSSVSPQNFLLPMIERLGSVSSVGLMSVQRVTYEEDCCTDKLQTYLEDGWRIIAVCPPNDARRPTYILGHTQPK